ncbi:MAG: hypothetical protein D6704_10195 [Nitrospirae bacterium]|nr:MAG: hypothetical protein D6704_10195 [Nitrospirota bacterium]
MHESWGSIMYNTFGTTDPGGTDGSSLPNDTDANRLQAYLDWRASLDTPDEGIAWFNIWLRDNVNAWNWGERLVSNPDYMPTATAASGWQVEVVANPWGLFSFTTEDARQISAPGQTYADGTDIT